ncbi:SPOR domain-containing protein [Novosphingobium aureum]|nr:SPOR domain-containing protein [Novosphingobium aureum]
MLGCLGVSLALLGAFPAMANVKDGVDAWSAGDYAGAVQEWEPLAENGDPDALFNLAQAYKLGRGVAEDRSKSLELYREAAVRGHVQAADNYGLALFQSGEREKAIPYLEASAGRGDPRAMYILGIAHFNGDLVAKDWTRAYAMMTLVRQAGLPQATGALAQMDEYIPLEQRQESVILAQRMAAQAQATRAQLATSSELASPRPAQASTTPKQTGSASTEIGPANSADPVKAAIRTAGSASPATAGADFARPAASSGATQAVQVHKTAPVTRSADLNGAAPATTAPSRPTRSASVPAVPTRPQSGPWRLQLGAFGIPGNADKLWKRLRSRPELAGHDKVLEPEGKLTKLLATGFASHAQASATCDTLAAAGFACLAVRN